MKIDLRSDTLTRPTPEMIMVMANAEVGDDCYGEDKNVIALEEYCADYFGKAAALFMSSGTMSNQVAMRSLIRAGDEIICDASYHINYFESAQVADLGRGVLNTVSTNDGVLTAAIVQEAIERKARFNNSYAAASLIWLENSISLHGGHVFPLKTMQELHAWANEVEIPIFIDGARILNASIAAGVHPSKYAACADAMAVCFSKGLRAPYGSILVGSQDFIASAKRFRKWYGGGLHQSGYMAAAALYAIQNNLDQIAQDNENAILLQNILSTDERIKVKDTQTNIVHFDIIELGISSVDFVQRAQKEGVVLFSWMPGQIRAVISSNVDRNQIIEAGNRLLSIANTVQRNGAQQQDNRFNNQIPFCVNA